MRHCILRSTEVTSIDYTMLKFFYLKSAKLHAHHYRHCCGILFNAQSASRIIAGCTLFFRSNGLDYSPFVATATMRYITRCLVDFKASHWGSISSGNSTLSSHLGCKASWSDAKISNEIVEAFRSPPSGARMRALPHPF